MSYKPPNFLQNIKHANIITDGQNGSAKPSDKSGIMADTNKVSEDEYILRLQEMAELVAHLENLVEQQAKEIAEITATNSKFVAIIAHDLRGPFTSILGVLELLRNSLDNYDNNKIKKFIDLASESANSTYALLESLLARTIAQNKERKFYPVKINLCELVQDEITSFKMNVEQKHLTLHHSIQSNLNVSADLQMVKTIFRNLIGNAVKYTPTGGEIIISASENNQFVEIVVSDNGIGISPEDQKKLFKINMFHSTAGTNQEQGVGLGLLLCKEFIELHSGNIVLESESGKGSKFKFTLPHYL
jgi:two-component system, sensor histidine kinase and response regulator